MRTRATAAALLVGAALISGCGAAKEKTKTFKGTEAEVAAVVKELSKVLAKRDSAPEICKDLLSPGSVAAIVAKQKQPCVDALPDLLRAVTARTITVQDVTVTGDRAKAAIKIPASDKDHKATLNLRKIGTEWRIVLVGGK